jgi:hypothetical protein
MVLGYDLRVSARTPFDWPPSRMETFLLRQDVLKPLSVDSIVWEKVDNSNQERLNHFGFWNSIEDAQNSIDGIAFDLPPAFVKLEIAWLASEENTVDRYFEEIPTSPTSKMHPWIDLGYDVADTGLISSIMNCGHAIQEIEYYTQHPSLFNEFHLFRDFGDAHAFLQKMSVGRKANDPLFVYGISMLANPSAHDAPLPKEPEKHQS